MHIFYIYFLLHCLMLHYVTGNFTVLRSRRSTQKLIIEENKCGAVKTICNNLSEYDDLSVLECLLSSYPKPLSNLNEDCQHVIWQHTTALIQDEKVKEALLPTCRTVLDPLHCNIDSGNNYLKCILNNINDIQDVDCKQMILRLENVAFTDYQWISGFLRHCTDDVDILNCGKFDPQNHSQGKTITCLQKNILNVQDDCKKEVFRLSELQSDNIKLDAQLYSDCAQDHSRFCPQFFAGTGRVFSCLLQQMHRDQNKLAPKCREHLQRRQKLIAQDYRVSKGLLKACKEDIRKTHCKRQISSDKTLRLAQILLCLESTVKNGTKIGPNCEVELIDHRRMLMEDYRLSPEIVNSCNSEISHFCKGIETGGRTIHCLMNHALGKAEKSNTRLQDKCMRALEDLVRETDVGENWTVDPVLQQACNPVVQASCRGISEGNARVMSCLMDKLGTNYMNDECESALIQIQYFVARDFKLDPQLYRECKKDAIKHCHVTEDDDAGPSYSPEVLPCLYRYAYLPQQDMKLEKTCLQQIRRVMRQRAVSVDLQPEIEEVCLKDLAFLCHDKVKKGEEMQCLQNKLDEIDEKCRIAVESFTEIEAQHVDLNPYISKYCAGIIESLCKLELDNDEGDIMDCLIEHKNNPVVKSNHACRASIEHFQIISLKDYRFTYKFKVACKSHAMRLCSHARSKNEVVACLSEQMLNATVHGLKTTIPKDCKQQLRSQIFQQRENIDFDPILKAACGAEIKKFCGNLQPGESQVLECLQSLPHGKLTNKCDKEVFKVQKLEIYDNTVDYALVTLCAEAIDQFCPHHERETILECLKMSRDKKGFNKKCRMTIMHRMIEQNTNYQLNPSLQENCHLDIKKFCRNELFVNANNEKSEGDLVIKCLKNQFKAAHLSDTCEKEMADILREQALNVDLNPLIKLMCKFEIETICKFDEEDSEKVEECLKTSLMNNKIQTPECKLEVANMIEESVVDIQVDPLLQRVCALDLLKFCTDVPQGNGRRIQCLRIIMESKSQNLTPNCRNKLKERFEMYRNAAREVEPPSDLQQLVGQIASSPSKNYFLTVLLLVIAGIFVIGVFCGQVTKSKYKLLKNK